MKLTKRLSLIFFLALPFLTLLVRTTSNSAEGQSIVLTHEVLLESDADPWAMIAAASDSRMIVAGNSGHDAWAAKFDTRGQTVWNYTLSLQDEFKYPVPTAQFRGAASMHDGSVFLCGIMPRPPGSAAPSLMLVHLDVNGHPLSEAFLTPDSRTNPGVQARSADACVRSNDGVVVLAEASRSVRSAGVPPKLERFYWVFALDLAGRIKWETQIPMLLRSGFDSAGITLASVGPGVIFSACNDEFTELLTIDDSGAVKSRHQILGRFNLVRPVPVDGKMIQLFGNVDNQLQPIVVTLDDHLVEVSRFQGDNPRNFSARHAYSTPGGFIALFGATVHDRGANYTSLVVSVDGALKSAQTLELPHTHRPIKDIGFIRAAAASGNAGEFVVARRIFVSGQPVNLSEGARVKEMFRLELDYLQFK